MFRGGVLSIEVNVKVKNCESIIESVRKYEICFKC